MQYIPERLKRLVQNLRFKKRSNEQSHDLDKKLVQSLQPKRLPNWSQIKRVSLFLTSKEKRVVSILGLIIVVSFSAWAYLFYKENVITVPAKGGSWSEALIGQPTFINPILAQASDTDQDISRLIFRGLLSYDKQTTLVTDLAASYEIDDSRTKYTVTLRDDIEWQDGEPITVDDVIFTIRAIQDPEWQSPLLVSFKGITTDKLDERTVAFNLPEPFGPFLSLLTTGILPKHIWEDIPASSARLAEFNIKPIGSGPWQFKEFAKDRTGQIRSYTLEQNKKNKDKTPFITEFTFKFYPDFYTAVDALNQKQVLGISFLPVELQSGVANPENINFNQLNLPQYTALFFNQKNNEFIKSKTVRRALARAINKKELIAEGLNGLGNSIDSPILALEQDDATTSLSYDRGEAEDLLQEAGWKLNDQGYRVLDDEVLSVRLTTVDQLENKAVAEAIKRYWEAIGVQTTVQFVSQSDIQTEVIRNRDYEILLYGAIVGADPDPYPFWHSSQTEHPGLNLSNFRDANTDALLEEARQVTEPSARLEKYETFKKILLEEVPSIFLYSPTYTYVQSKRLQGFDVSNLIIPADRFNNSNEWYIKTKRTLK